MQFTNGPALFDTKYCNRFLLIGMNPANIKYVIPWFPPVEKTNEIAIYQHLCFLHVLEFETTMWNATPFHQNA